MKLIGITGGFCSGKTTVAGFFKDLGARVIDADKIVHQLYKSDNVIRAAIRKNFGTIDRKKLARKAFARKRLLRKLCDLIHPAVLKKIKKLARSGKNKIVVIDAPLLIETGLHRSVNATIVVKASFSNQLKRALARGFTARDVILRKRAQMPLKDKIKFADFVLNNNGPKRLTRKQTEKIWNKLKRG